MKFLFINLIIALYFTSLSVFCIGFFVLLKGFENKTNRLFAFYSLAIAWWSFLQASASLVEDASASLLLFRIMNMAVFLIPPIFLHFLILFLNLKNKKRFLIGGYLVGIFFAGFSFSHYMTPNVSRKLFGSYFMMNAGNMYILAIIFHLSLTAYGIYKLFIELKTAKDRIRHNQMKYLFWSTLFGYIGAMANWFFVYNIFIPILAPFGTYLVAIYAFIVAYIILKYQLMNIDIILKKTFAVFITITLISVVMIAISFLNGWFVRNIPGFKIWFIPLLVGLTTFFIGNLFWRKEKEINKMKYGFITIAAHKLRTPLTKIKWGLEVLPSALPKKILKNNSELISKINKSARRTIELAEELLPLAKTKTDNYLYKIELTSLTKITKEVIQIFKDKIADKNIKLTFYAQKRLPKIRADKKRIRSVIQILLENAIDYISSKNGKIKIEIKKEGKNIRFSIADNGIGIKKDEQSYIFTGITNERQNLPPKTKRLGVGLFIAKNIITKHKGKIGVESGGGGKGSAFWFKLPVK